MELDLDLETEHRMELYCDLLVRYLLVGSALGECELYRNLGQVLDSGDADRMATALRSFDNLPEDLRSRILEGDPTLATMEAYRTAEEKQKPPRARRNASA